MARQAPHRAQRRVTVDEHWLNEWVIFGFTEIDKYLAKWASFEEYLREKET